MNFLAPWFLLGALAVAGPILFHLIRRSARERLPFSSLLFLRPTPPRATRRRKLEHILLLLLRCVALLLLALGFARPFFPSGHAAPPLEEGRAMVILVDTSASMRRTGLWSKALALAEKHLDKAGPMDRIAMMTFDRQTRSLVTFDEWASWPTDQRAALARRRLEGLSPGWGGTQLGPALINAAESFPDQGGSSASMRDVAVISDLQEGAKLDGLQGHDWPKDVHVVLERVDPAQPGNAGLEILGATGRDARVRVVNSRDSGQEKFAVTWSGGGAATPVYVPPGQGRTLLAPPLATNLPADSLLLTGDNQDFDNTAWFAPPEIDRVTIAYFGAESPNDPNQLRYYLQRAFPGSSERRVSVEPATPDMLSHAALAVIPSTLDLDQGRALRGWMAEGHTALLVLTNTQGAGALGALAGLPAPQIAEAAGGYALLGDIDFTHPIFAVFADPKYSDFSRIHFWKHRIWPQNPAVRVLAKFDDGSPALAQIPVGKGNLLVLASGWQPSDSQLALSSKFLPLLHTILDFGAADRPARAQFQIGEAIPCPAGASNDLTWFRPDGKTVVLAAGKPFTQTDVPGFYVVTVAGQRRRFAVNLAPEESRTAPLSADDFARLGVPLGNSIDLPPANAPGGRRRMLEEELENRQKAWRWMIVVLLAVALAEIWLGGWLARRERIVEVAA